jgi:hypothetical protein
MLALQLKRLCIDWQVKTKIESLCVSPGPVAVPAQVGHLSPIYTGTLFHASYKMDNDT